MTDFKDMVNDVYEYIERVKVTPSGASGLNTYMYMIDGEDCTDPTFNTAEFINSRYSSWKHWATYRDASTWPSSIPDNYIAGRDFDVIVIWTTDSSTSGNARVKGGITKLNSGVYDLNNQQFVGYLTPAGPTSTHEVIETTFTFSGTGLTPGEDLVFRFINDDIVGTLNDNVKVLGVIFEWPANIRR